MSLLTRAFPVFCLASSLALACSSGGGGGGSGAAQFAERYCALLAPCCAELGAQADMKGCRTLFGLSQPKDQGAAEECMQEYEARAQQSNWCTTFDIVPRPASCERAFPREPGSGGSGGGTKLPGAACETSNDCAPSAKGSLGCSYDFDTESGHCQVCTIAQIGEACSGVKDAAGTITEDVPSGTLEIALCDRTAGANAANCEDGVCVRLAELGQTCATSYSCADDQSYCDGTCKARLPPGSSCLENLDACDDAGYCDYSDARCKSRVADGEECDSNSECSSGYCYDTCQQYPGIGGVSLFLWCQ